MSLLQDGQRIGATYEVERLLGEGAFAEVYRVNHRSMAQRDAGNGNGPVLCGHEDLMAAVWGEEAHTQDELSRLVHDLRAKLGDSSVRRLVENQPGLGYRLLTCS